MSEALPRRRGASVVTGYAAVALLGLAACAPSKPKTAPTPMNDPRVGLKAGLFDAGEAISNMKVVAKAVSPPGFLGITNSDLAFTGKYAIQGNYNGPVIWDISNPAKPVLVVAYTCPASQNDISVYKNLMFMSAEANNGRVDCKPGGVPDPVSKERMRGVRVFDISDIKNPKLIANVQTCRGSHTHTVLEDPKDKENVYIYVSGSSGIRSAGELEGCADVAADDPNSSRLRIEIIKVPLANPASAAVVGRANIFAGLGAAPAHGLSDADKEAAAKTLAAAKASGAFIAKNPQSGAEMVVPPQVIRPLLENAMKARGGSTVNAADSATVRGMAQGAINTMFAGAAGGAPTGRGGERSQCHDITVYPALGLAGGACEGHGLLLDISNPVAPVRLDAAADSNFAYWHSATFNNDGSKVLFTDEWGGGGAPKCRATDPMTWGANAMFTVGTDRKMTFVGYYKMPAAQTAAENCVAHNGSLIPVPGRDIMVQAWYQGGISIFDWTNPAKPMEIAYHDRGPVDSTKMEMGGSWSVYWYNGSIVSSEIARGLDIFELTPSPMLSANEIAAANTVQLEYLNAQGQPTYVWPASFAKAQAFVDQLERSSGLSAARITAVRSGLASAEKATGAARTTALRTMARTLAADVKGSSDAAKVTMLRNAVTELSAAR